MTTFITGGAGFIGIKLTEELLKNNKHRIYIIDNFLKSSGNNNLLKINKQEN